MSEEGQGETQGEEGRIYISNISTERHLKEKWRRLSVKVFEKYSAFASTWVSLQSFPLSLHRQLFRLRGFLPCIVAVAIHLFLFDVWDESVHIFQFFFSDIESFNHKKTAVECEKFW